MRTEPTRQVHLDFHTSEHLPDIGAEFSEDQFQEALRAGRVNQINVFAKCHHSWCYYPTKVGVPHPNLTTDLLGRQIEACHEIGVVAPVYVTGGWSAHDAEEHPDWCMRSIDGDFITHDWPADAKPENPKPTFQWKELCVTGEYHEHMVALTDEICRLYPADGFFFDIYRAHELCYCERCRAGMSAEGIDLRDADRVAAYRARTIRAHAEEISDVIRGHHPQASVYFNGTTAIERSENFRYRLHELNTKNDLEDLPTTWGGYDKFPLRAKIFHRERKPVVAMSGKFHTAWGEFGGFKDPDALRFEAASMVAYGASCNFGDHLHPLGAMDATTYRSIGHAFAYVEEIEAYGPGGLPASSLGFWASYDLPADEGLARMLLEEQIDFDVVTRGDELSGFETIVVPSYPGLLDGARAELDAFVAGGGSLVLLGAGALAGDAVALRCGARFLECPSVDVDYTLVGPAMHETGEAIPTLHRPASLPVTPFLNYDPALAFELDEEAELLATVEDPYFSRTYGSYCGHQNTPNRPGVVARPAAWRHGNVIVLAHALDRMYYANGAKVHRDLFARALRMVHTAPMVEAELPSAGRVSLLHQPEQRRYVAHLLYGAPIERGRCLVIEDLPELRDVTVRLRLPETARALRLVPDGVELPMREVGAPEGKGGAPAPTDGPAARRYRTVETTVPRFRAHCAVVAEY
ncbi:MAG: hypothetical protein ACOCWX_01870 [Spirochaetota bacterium]